MTRVEVRNVQEIRPIPLLAEGDAAGRPFAVHQVRLPVGTIAKRRQDVHEKHEHKEVHRCQPAVAMNDDSPCP
eukprot:SAG25_NODE_4772_length_751_cov_0.966258_1_plen_72_part_10